MKTRNVLWTLALAVISLTGWAGGLATGEAAVSPSGEPSKVGQATTDHMFVRGTYEGVTRDNVVSFDEGATKLVWLWLDDDAIYVNDKVQALTPVPYNAAGDLYNEITYNSFQCDIYLPEGVTLVSVEDEDGDMISYEHGDRLPITSNVFYQQLGTKVVDGVTYKVYTVLCTNVQAYGCHFSARTAKRYRDYGALKKDDAALVGFYLQYNGDTNAGEMPNMIIANQEFGFREAFTNDPVWEPNDYRFFYGTGGDNKTQRFQYYHRVRLFGNHSFTPTATPVISYRVTNDAVVITATGDGQVTLMIDGQQVDNPYRVTRGNEDFTVIATATAQEEGKDVSDQAMLTIVVPAKPGTDMQENNMLTIPGQMYVQSGKEFVLPVAMTNSAPVSALQCDVVLPDGFAPVMEDGQYKIDLIGDRVMSSHNVSARMLADGALRVLIASPVADPFVSNEGDLFVLHMTTTPDVADGIYALRLENVILADANASTYYAPDVTTDIIVKNYLKGDANGDDAVNVGDYVTTTNYILGMDPDPFIFTAADVDENSAIDVGDLVGIVNLVMGGDVQQAASHQSNDNVSLDGSFVASDNTYVVTLSLKNDVSLTAWQMDMHMEEGIMLTGAQLSSRAVSHTLAINDLSNGNVKLLSSSPMNEELIGHKGDLLTLEFICDPSEVFEVGFNHILMAESDMTIYELKPVFLSENQAISVNELSSNLRIYGKDGMVVVETPIDTTVELIATNGMNRTVTAKAGVNTYPVERGIHIVRVGGQVAKLKF